MSNLSVSNTFTALTTILSAQVNTNFSDIVSYVNNRNSASAAWDQLSVAGNAAIVGTLTNTGPINIGASSGTSFSVNSTDLKVDSTNHRVGIGLTPSFTLDVTGTSITGRFRSSTGPMTLALGTGSSGSTNDVQLTFSDGVGTTFSVGTDASASNILTISNSATLGTNNLFTMTTGGVATFLTQLIAKGTATNDSASAGYIGEYVSSSVTTTANMASTGTYGNITSITLSAGDWDVIGSAFFDPNGATVTGGTGYAVAISTFTGNTTTDHVNGDNVLYGTPGAVNPLASVTVHYRMSVSTSTIVYLKTQTSYSAGPPKTAGTIKARRVR